jgi:hypothetical protein
MAGLNLTPIETGGGRKPLEEIPVETAETVEEAYAYFQTPNALPRLQTDPFPSRKDADKFMSDARAYCYQREAGRLQFAGNPARAKGEPAGSTVVRFRIDAATAATAE